MNSNIDVLKELEVKNKEIYINKLNIDIDNNLEILLITIDNMISLFTTSVTNDIQELKSGVGSKEHVLSEVAAFHEIIRSELIKLINKRNDNLKEKIFEIDKIDYKKVLDDETKLLIDKIKKCYTTNVGLLINKIELDDKNRLKVYLEEINYEKFINKIKEIIVNMDIILFNNYKESYQKFLNLNEKTLR